ncbi:MAG TPA: lytic murein transglycosylase [Nocardioidaceae bacterium]|nr:lytic murein transglycosylase [Nocardioidaceae bacterium]
MTTAWGRRVRGPLSAVLALALAPVVAVASAPSTPAAHVGASAQPEPAFTEDPFEHNADYYSVAQAAVLSAGPARISRSRDGKGEEKLSPKGRLWEVSELGDNGLPKAAEKAYRRAAAQIALSDPGCQLPWTLLAGIGRVESDHGRYGGARLGADGYSRPRIIGVQLNGAGPVAAIRDTDDGRLDGDRKWDRAVGPMQFIPSTWEFAARDGDDDGRMSPHDLDDAAAAAASYLCSGSGSLLYPSTQAAAIYRYNQDEYYVALVQAFEVGYRTGVFVIPAPPPSEEELAELRRKRRAAKQAKLREERRERRRLAEAAEAAEAEQEAEPAPKPSPKPTSSPSPSPSPTPKPSPKPTPTEEPDPAPYETSGKLTKSDGAYYLAGELLDLGAVAQLDAEAAGDYDEDGAVETNGVELEGLVAMDQVTMVVVEMDDGKLGIYSINGKSVSG